MIYHKKYHIISHRYISQKISHYINAIYFDSNIMGYFTDHQTYVCIGNVIQRWWSFCTRAQDGSVRRDGRFRRSRRRRRLRGLGGTGKPSKKCGWNSMVSIISMVIVILYVLKYYKILYFIWCHMNLNAFLYICYLILYGLNMIYYDVIWTQVLLICFLNWNWISMKLNAVSTLVYMFCQSDFGSFSIWASNTRKNWH